MAPEQALGQHAAVGPQTDLYALACTTYELFTGRAPFEDENDSAVLLAHLQREPPPISRFSSSLAPFDDVFRRALAKLPSDRQATCESFVADLDVAARRFARRSLAPSTLPPPAPARQVGSRIRVVMLEGDAALRRQLVRIIERAISTAGDTVTIEHAGSPEDVERACRDAAPEIVVVDEDVAASGALVERLLDERKLPDASEVLRLQRTPRREQRTHGSLVELQKPLNAHVLASVVTKMAARVVARRSGIVRAPR